MCAATQLFVHFFSPAVCLRTGPRATSKRGREQREWGLLLPPRKGSHLLGLGQLLSGQDLPRPLWPSGCAWFLWALCECLKEHIRLSTAH